MPWNTAALRLCCILSTLLWSSGNAIDCELRQTCSDCITIDLTCGWCADEGVRLDSRCRLNGMHTDCGNVFAPASEIVVPQEPPPATAISPETYNVSLRNTDTLSLPIDVTTVRNIPLDLYILFDVSQSMDEEISAIQGASAEIIARLQNITDDVQVGVGSYVDKATLPFSRRNLTQESGCIKPGGPCYNFRHYGRMTNSREELSERFSRIETGSNIDAPEAGLDAMAQAVICNESVGWRDSAVKMILTFTDDAFKFSGEGRQGGILTPFETVCGLTNSTETNSYTMYSGLRNDYTSPGQLLSFLESSNIIPVFVSVTSSAQAQGFYNVSQTHQELARLYNMRLSGRASFASVNTTGTNETGIANSILTIIDQQVLFILSQTGLSPERINGISFSVKAECPARAIELNEGTNMESCSNVSVGDTTRFTLNVKLLDCEVFGTETREVAVSVFPLGRVVIEITPICSCLCDDYEVNSPRCSFNGNFSCGECTCKEGYCGLQCQFNVSVRTGCPDGLGENICSGERGACLGTCECVCEMNLTAIVDNPKLLRVGVNASAFGPACECDYFTCLPPTGSETTVCSGNGDCCNGKCVCHFDENGNQYRSDGTNDLNCRCKPAEVVCQPNSTELCSGVGRCDCDSCNCPEPYSGQHCQYVGLEDCFDLATEPEIETCILNEKGRTNRETRCQSCSFSVFNTVNVSCVLIIPLSQQPTSADEDVVQKTIVDFVAQTPDGPPGTSYKFIKMCFFVDNDSCTHDYYVVYNEDDISELVFVAEEQRRCPSTSEAFQLPIELWALAIILLGLLLLFGLFILVIIKLLFLLLDYFEVKRLEKEVGMADFSKNQNPLYQSPDVEYKNVAYGKE